MQIRIAVSSINAGTLFELRAQVRERMLAWLSALEGGRFLVRTRVDEVASYPNGAPKRGSATVGAPG